LAHSRLRLTGRLRGAAVCALLLTPTACTQIDNALASVPVFAFLRESPGFDAHENPRPAPPGSVPFEAALGEILPPLEGTSAALEAFAATPAGINPLGRDDAAALEIGRVMYERHCAVCHGVTGLGDGPVIGPGKFPLAPSLVSGPALGLSDGYVYGIIRAGRGLMPAYGGRISHLERWTIVNYLHALQAGAGVTATPAAPGAPTDASQGAPGAAPAPADTAPAGGATGNQDETTGEERL
jgi:mono/diheme cytochrome c family protein